MAKNKLFRILFWGFLFLVLYATLTPLDGVEPLGWSFADKIIHLVIFLILTLLMFLSYPKLSAVNIILIMSFYGILIEFLQHVLPTGRSFDWYDWLFDIFGVFIGFVIFFYTPIPKAIHHFLKITGITK